MSTSRIAAVAMTIGLGVAGLAGAASASAAVVERGTYLDTYDDTFDACGTTVNVTGSTPGHYVLRVRGDSPFVYATDHFVDSATYTNLATGRNWLAVSKVTHVDLLTVVVQGTVVQQTMHEAGTFSVYDGNGVLAYRQSGLRTLTAVVDTMGTADDQDDQVLDFDYETSGHFPSSDFCADLAAFTT